MRTIKLCNRIKAKIEQQRLFMTFDWSSQIRDGRGNQAALECWSLAWGVLSHLSHLAQGEAGMQFKSVSSHNNA